MAKENINNPKRAADFIKLAVAKKGKASRREQVWIDAYAKFYADGHVRWQNISYQPFADAQWLLGEAKRLLSVPVNETKTAAN